MLGKAHVDDARGNVSGPLCPPIRHRSMTLVGGGLRDLARWFYRLDRENHSAWLMYLANKTVA